MRKLSRAQRRANGVYYTPLPLIEHVLARTLGRLLRGKTPAEAERLRILDPACGTGHFLTAAYRYLLDWHRRWYRTHSPLRGKGGPLPGQAGLARRILGNCIFGLDIDPDAVAVARRALLQLADHETACNAGEPPNLAANIRCGNALVGPDLALPAAARRQLRPFDWDAAFPAIQADGGFDVVLGNPPWGQKGVGVEPAVKHYLAARFPSSAGIFDLFRPFVELGVRLTAGGGMFGMVLPDILLLKDYPATRRFLLDQLMLTAIDWWGRSFPEAVIDTVTVIGRKRPAPPHHAVRVGIHSEVPRQHAIPQADFRANPRHVFNLFLTPERRGLLQRLQGCPRLGDYFEVHEGVHSGNMRAELFVSTPLDASSRPLLLGREEIRPYQLDWQGGYVRLGALPGRRTPRRYANLGRQQWHERDKVLVRRTGDRVLAAVDRQGFYASNNFFLVFPRRPCSLNLDGLCALLNSRFLTWYFRTIEPRQGRAFAELKIKHLATFPLPPQVQQPNGCRRLNRLGARRRNGARLDAAIEALVLELFGIDARALEQAETFAAAPAADGSFLEKKSRKDLPREKV